MKTLRIVLALWLSACADTPHSPTDAAPAPALCSDSWYQWVERQLPTGDGQGHGPDRGSEEWQSVVEFRLGVRGQAQVPARKTEAWCHYINQRLRSQSAAPAWCLPAPHSSAEQMICSQPHFWPQDVLLTQVYQQASEQASQSSDGALLRNLKAEQRGWIKGRNDCWKAEDPGNCIASAYRLRTAELQARYRLVAANQPNYFYCGGDRANEMVITYFQTEPPSLIAERGDQRALMFVQPAASGARYQGRNESFWEHQGEARVTWGVDAAPEICQSVR